MAHDSADAGVGRYALPRVLDHWYVVCRSDELGTKPRATTLFASPLVLFRDQSGQATALLDRCAHRNMPLRVGRVVDGTLECRYHGWRFASDGRCTTVPALCGAPEGPARRVPRFALREQQGLIWVYARAEVEPQVEPYLLPHADDAAYQHVRYAYVFEATLLSTLENILDVPHTAFLHKGLFRGGRKQKIQAEVVRQGTQVQCAYRGEAAPRGLAGRLLAPKGGEVTHFDRFILPSVAQVEYRLGKHSHLLLTNLLTPLADFRTGLLAHVSLRLPYGAAALVPILRPLAMRIVQQDAEALALQTATILHFGGEQFVSTDVDVMAPHILRLLRHAERGESCAPASEQVELNV